MNCHICDGAGYTIIDLSCHGYPRSFLLNLCICGPTPWCVVEAVGVAGTYEAR